MGFEFERISISKGLPESPRWLHQAGLLCWVDIPLCTVEFFDPMTRHMRRYDLPSRPGAVVPTVESNEVMLALPGRMIRLNVETGRFETHAEWDDNGGLLRANDGACDHRNRFWFGSMVDEDHSNAADLFSGSIFRMHGRSIEEMAAGLGCPNSLCAVGDRMLHADTETGEMGFFAGNERTAFFPSSELPGLPDGATVAADGTIWHARWEGGCLVQMAPSGEVLERFDVPGRNVTSCCFAGPALDTIVITVAEDNGDGGVYWAPAPTKGKVEPAFRLKED